MYCLLISSFNLNGNLYQFDHKRNLTLNTNSLIISTRYWTLYTFIDKHYMELNTLHNSLTTSACNWTINRTRSWTLQGIYCRFIWGGRGGRPETTVYCEVYSVQKVDKYGERSSWNNCVVWTIQCTESGQVWWEIVLKQLCTVNYTVYRKWTSMVRDRPETTVYCELYTVQKVDKYREGVVLKQLCTVNYIVYRKWTSMGRGSSWNNCVLWTIQCTESGQV